MKRRDRIIEDLEEDNVKLSQCKTELESQLSKRDFKMKKLERRLTEMQGEVRLSSPHLLLSVRCLLFEELLEQLNMPSSGVEPYFSL